MPRVTLNHVARHLAQKFPSFRFHIIENDVMLVRPVRKSTRAVEIKPTVSAEAKSSRELCDRSNETASTVNPQNKTRDLFGLASTYAKEALQDPVRAKIYQRVAKERGTSAYAIAVGDWMRAPLISHVSVTTRAASNERRVFVFAQARVEVASVEVIIRDSASERIVAQGFATPSSTRKTWEFVIPQTAPTQSLLQIEAIARNHSGKSASYVMGKD